MKLSVAIVSSTTCSPARLTFKLMTRAKYCKTASLDSGPALTNALKIWNSECYRPGVSQIGTPPRVYHQRPTCKLFRVPLRLAVELSISARLFLSMSPKYVSEMVGHSCPNTFNLHKGPIKLTLSMLAAVAFSGFHSSNRVIITAMGLIDTRASRPAMTRLQPESDPAKPSLLNRLSWKTRARTTGPRTPSSSSSGSKRLTMSWRNGSTSVGESLLGEEMGVERSGPESEERDRRGPRSSGGPTSRLVRSVNERKRGSK